jgi:hypothetical protein
MVTLVAADCRFIVTRSGQMCRFMLTRDSGRLQNAKGNEGKS